ncbi:hypothetical protein [Brevibacillus thermoruber]|uniref:hypothetical protein n=1 Tax=Brevibacillus thermoruber TaxID=33942 RepID=UPI0004104AB5|nr:hypothetical protein [Brevibacillus thermoruber]
MTERDGQAAEGEQELLRLYILFGLLFRTAMADWGQVRQVPLKLSYHWFFEELSRWAERQHHRLRRHLRQRGCVLLSARRERGVYVVQYRQRGYVREAVYSIEVLRAECQELARLWIMRQQAPCQDPGAMVPERHARRIGREEGEKAT